MLSRSRFRCRARSLMSLFHFFISQPPDGPNHAPCYWTKPAHALLCACDRSLPRSNPTPVVHPIFPPICSPLPVPVAALPPTSNQPLPSSSLLPPAIYSPSPSSNPALPPASPSHPAPIAKKNYREDEGSDDRCSAGTEDVDYICPVDSVVNATSSEAHFMEVCDDFHALSIVEMNTYDMEECGKATESDIGNNFTAAVKMPGLNSSDKADPMQRSQAVQRNVTEGSDHKFVGPVYKGLLEDGQLIALK